MRYRHSACVASMPRADGPRAAPDCSSPLRYPTPQMYSIIKQLLYCFSLHAECFRWKIRPQDRILFVLNKTQTWSVRWTHWGDVLGKSEWYSTINEISRMYDGLSSVCYNWFFYQLGCHYESIVKLGYSLVIAPSLSHSRITTDGFGFTS